VAFVATRTVRVDDFDEKTEGAEPVFFSLNDVFYALDLAPANLKKLEDAMQPFMDKARESEAPRGGRRQPASAYNGSYIDMDPAKIRAWCNEKGIPVNDKGRIPEATQAQYRAAMQAQQDK
jgi:Lsr2